SWSNCRSDCFTSSPSASCMGRFLHQSFHVMLKTRLGVSLNHHVLHGKLLPSLDHRTTASGTSIRCSFGSVTVSESVSPARMGRSPESLQPVQERFHTVSWPSKRPHW